jgi:RNA polymerase sigma-70 factor (ECF subfamily)
VSRPTRRDDDEVVQALRAGDEATFRALVDLHSPALLRVAMAYVPSRAVAEEAVQETWIALMRGIDRFEGRSSLKTWLFRILTNVALKGGGRERRSVPWSSVGGTEDTGEPAVDPDRFLPHDHDRFPGHWALGPTRWPTPEEGLLSGETREVLVAALKELPPAQQMVVTLREIGGWTSDDVAEALGISPGNERVLLHRARARMRAAVERYYGAVEATLPYDDVGGVTPAERERTGQTSMEPER